MIAENALSVMEATFDSDPEAKEAVAGKLDQKCKIKLGLGFAANHKSLIMLTRG